MRKFETLVLISPELPVEARDAALEKIKGVIERSEGQIAEVDVWGMRDLAYPVRKLQRGYYVRFEYCGPGAIVAELERNLRITEGILKFLTVKLDDEVEGGVN
ncbi:MAG: 30S ribosomal protein S6 [Desulfovibrionaceae bacterium]|nr:30S ribosomal protein S6 [Desulfovibrionaceae bacterium]